MRKKKACFADSKSVIDGQAVWDECAEICEELSDLYSWQDNSEGQIIFAGKVLYLFLFKGEDVEWFLSSKFIMHVPSLQRLKKCALP